MEGVVLLAAIKWWCIPIRGWSPEINGCILISRCILIVIWSKTITWLHKARTLHQAFSPPIFRDDTQKVVIIFHRSCGRSPALTYEKKHIHPRRGLTPT